MAETQQKRLRNEIQNEFDDSNPNSKRQKPYNNILSLLDEEEDPIEDLSAIFTTLEQELSASTTTAFDFDSPTFAAEEDDAPLQETAASDSGEEDDGVKSVIRHLLEASDDELGIPNTDYYNNEIRSDENLIPFEFVDDGIWELEDVAANYYTVLQSELVGVDLKLVGNIGVRS